ncbi:MAG: DUF3847 domain-containing protein [Ruminiclostridium sp.]|nr:DUF3847 domain-containing protein [Ruminiclostridium sp.]
MEELKRKKAEAEKKAEQYRHQEQRLTNRMEYYRQKKRKERNHRLIVRGASVENIWPEVKAMSEETFDRLMREVLELPGAKKVLDDILGGGG